MVATTKSVTDVQSPPVDIYLGFEIRRHADQRAGDRDSGDARAEPVEDRGTDRHNSGRGLVAADRVTGLADLGECLVQASAGGDGAWPQARQPGGHRVVDVGLGAVRQQHLADDVA